MSLLREKTEAQIKLLTAQIHPHFLFNTLNNIYSQTQSESPKGSAMIIELAEILRYTLGEGQKQFVPLANELNLLRNYINLEKVRYGNNLKLHVEMPVETGDWQIAPLLLLPFLENCFKHGTSKFLQEPWIKLQISLEDATLNFKLMNGKDVSQANKATQSGIGNANVRTRLELLYPDKHNLTIVDEEDVYIVQLRLQLDNKQRSNRISENLIPKPAYA